jgi:L-amino acid N-acyltransferase YncA
MGEVELNLTVRPAAPADLSHVGDIFAWYALHSVATFEHAARTQAYWS